MKWLWIVSAVVMLKIIFITTEAYGHPSNKSIKDHYTIEQTCIDPSSLPDEQKFLWILWTLTKEGTNPLCQNTNVYSHSTISFWHEGHHYTVEFVKR